MRRLLYVPIIHSQPDLGSLGPAIEGMTASLLGKGHWARHQETVAQFWKAIEDYFASLEAKDLRIYQDGLAAEGQLGRRVVEEAARRGSKNHQVLLDLLERGAEIRKTEDVSLLLEEGRRLLEAAGVAIEGKAREQAGPQKGKGLTEERDRFVAARINETLREGETGVLFMGAYHDLLSLLAKDILVTSVKEPEKVRAYFQKLVAGGDEEKSEELARYLAAPVQ